VSLQRAAPQAICAAAILLIGFGSASSADALYLIVEPSVFAVDLGISVLS
jgi:hypothetical protein